MTEVFVVTEEPIRDFGTYVRGVFSVYEDAKVFAKETCVPLGDGTWIDEVQVDEYVNKG